MSAGLSRPLVLITGGSRGIGAACAILAAQSGYDVAVDFKSDASAARSVVDSCRSHGVRAECFQADVADHQAILRLFDAVTASLGRVTHLVNNAGITGKIGAFDSAEPDMIRRVIDLNVTGAILVAQRAAREMRSGDAIVNISSAATTLGSAGEYVWYAASKGAINAFTIGLARELAAQNIRVNAVEPGLIDTDIHAAGGSPGRASRLAPHIPMQRAGSADEIARSVLYLLSSAASYVTGSILRVSGGR